MKKILSFTAALLAFVLVASAGDNAPLPGSCLRQLQKRDSVLVGDQLQYGVLLKDVPKDTRFAFPEYKGLIRDSVETVGTWQMDTVKVSRDKKSFDIQAYIKITSFEEGMYSLPPLTILRSADGEKIDTLVFEPLVLDIRSIPVDPETFELHGLRPQIKYPVTFREVLPYLAGLLLLAALVLLVIYLVKHFRKAAPVPDEPAHIVALRKLDSLRGDKLWAADKQKLFYSEVTDTLRQYIVARYGVDAMEMTTAEIMSSLKAKDVPAGLYMEMKELFETSDFVKFAKMTVGEDSLVKAVPSAVRFVTETYQREIDKEAENVL